TPGLRLTCWRVGWPGSMPAARRIAQVTDRSAEEREQARQERERRRLGMAQAQARPGPALTSPDDDWLEEDPLPSPPSRPESGPGRRPVSPRSRPQRRYSRAGRAPAP